VQGVVRGSNPSLATTFDDPDVFNGDILKGSPSGSTGK
jgi:hypothetical protein